MNRERFDELMELAASGCLDEAAAAEFERALAADPALRAEADADRRLVGVLGRAGQIVRATRRAPKGLLHGALAHARAQAAAPPSEVETSPLPNTLREPRSAKVIDVTPPAREAARRRPSALPWMMAAAALVVVAGGASFLALQMMDAEPKTFTMADASLSVTKAAAVAAPAGAERRLADDAGAEALATGEQPVAMMAAAPVVDFDTDGDVDLLVAELVTPPPAPATLATVSPDGTPPGAGEAEWSMAAATPAITAAAAEESAAPATERYFAYGNIGEPRHEAPSADALNLAEPAEEGVVTLARAEAKPAEAAQPDPLADAAAPTSYAPNGTPMRPVPASAAAAARASSTRDREVASGVGSGRAVAVAPSTAAASSALAGATLAASEASAADALAIAEVASSALAPDEVAFLVSNAVANGAVLRSARAAEVAPRNEATRAGIASAKDAPPLEELTLEFPNQNQYEVFRWRVENASLAQSTYGELQREALASVPAPKATARGQRQMVAPSQTPPSAALYQQAPGGESRDRGVQAPPAAATLGLASSFAPATAPTSGTATMLAAPGSSPRYATEARRAAPAAAPTTVVRVVPAGPVLGNRFATEVESPPESPRVRVRIRALPGSE